MGLTSLLTFGTGILILWQLFDRKGDWKHIIRWVAIFASSTLVVTINSKTIPAPWNNPAFIAHVSYGAVFFLMVGIVVPVLGLKLKRNPRNDRLTSWKLFSVKFTCSCWVASMASIFTTNLRPDIMLISLLAVTLLFLLYILYSVAILGKKLK